MLLQTRAFCPYQGKGRIYHSLPFLTKIIIYEMTAIENWVLTTLEEEPLVFLGTMTLNWYEKGSL